MSKLETLEKRMCQRLQKKEKSFGTALCGKKTRKGKWGQVEDDKLMGKNHESLWGKGTAEKFNYGIWK